MRGFELSSRSNERNLGYQLRMLLQHFPRAYVNFQQAGQRVEDGQHLSFVGTIMASRYFLLSLLIFHLLPVCATMNMVVSVVVLSSAYFVLYSPHSGI